MAQTEDIDDNPDRPDRGMPDGIDIMQGRVEPDTVTEEGPGPDRRYLRHEALDMAIRLNHGTGNDADVVIADAETFLTYMTE